MKLKSNGIVIIGLVAFILNSCNQQPEPIPQEDSIYGSWQLVGNGHYERLTSGPPERIETSASNGYKVTFKENGELIADCVNMNSGGTGGPCWANSSKLATGTFTLSENEYNVNLIEITLNESVEIGEGHYLVNMRSYDYHFEGQYLYIHNVEFDYGNYDKFVRIEPQNHKD